MGALRRIVRTLVIGRSNGFRARLRRRIFGERKAAAPAPPPMTPAPKEAPKGFVPPAGFEVVLHRDAVAAGQILEVIVGGKAIAVANVDGDFFAVSATCPHAGGPIGDGTMSAHTVTCPYHGWSYDVRNGKCFVNDDVKLPTYEVKVVGDAVCVRV